MYIWVGLLEHLGRFQSDAVSAATNQSHRSQRESNSDYPCENLYEKRYACDCVAYVGHRWFYGDFFFLLFYIFILMSCVRLS